MPSVRMVRCGAVVALAACALVQGPQSVATDADPQADATALVSPGTDQPITTGLLPGDRFYVRYRLTSRQPHPMLVEGVKWRVTTSNPACDKYFPVVTRSVRQRFPRVVAPHGQLDAGDNATFEYSSAAGSGCQSMDIYAEGTVTAVRVPSTTTVTGGEATLGTAGQFTATVDSAWRQTPGTVQFVVDSSDYGAPAPVLNGRAELTSAGLAAGTHVVVARYTPTDAGPEGSVSRPAAFHVTTDAPTTAPSPAPVLAPTPVPTPVPPTPRPIPSTQAPAPSVHPPVPAPAPSGVRPVPAPARTPSSLPVAPAPAPAPVASSVPATSVARPMPAPVASGVHAAPVSLPGSASELGVPPWERPDPRRAIG